MFFIQFVTVYQKNLFQKNATKKVQRVGSKKDPKKIKGSKWVQTWSKKGPKRVKKGPKRVPKGSQKGPKSPKRVQMGQKESKKDTK